MTARLRAGFARLAASALLAAAGLVLAAGAAEAGPTTLEATFTNMTNGWAKVERWRDTTSAIGQETFPPDGRGDQTGQRATFFGSARPSSARFLMYYGSAWDQGWRTTPVLLVHGANQDADLAWADPNEAGAYGCGQQTCPTTGLAQTLGSNGFRVFALNLAHKNGDGYIWAEEIADAVAIIKQRTGASSVDVVAWSKAASNARQYISNVRQSWGTAYRGDVRRLILLGGANNGIDLSFRQGWNFSLVVYPECGGAVNGPTPHTKLVCYGSLVSGPQWSYGSSYFPGSAQLLKRWDGVYPIIESNQDWYTTYYGGTGAYSVGPGIASYLSRSLVDVIRNAPSPAAVKAYELCGNTPNIAGFSNETSGPSDGVVFIQSCTDAVGLTTLGATAVIGVNHLGLGWTGAGQNQILAWLSAT